MQFNKPSLGQDDDWKKELEIEAAEAAAEEDEEDEEDEEEDEDLKYKMAVQAKDHGAL